MKYNRLHTAFLIISLAFIGLVVDSCKSKKQEIPPFIDVHLEVKDANNVPSTGATAYLYNSQEAFQAAYQNSLILKYNSIGSILTTTIVNGVVDLKGLPSNTEYWILVHDTSEAFIDPKNPTINTGYKIDKDNSEAYYKIDGFQNGTTVLANITLQPVTSLVKLNNVSGGGFERVELNSKDVGISTIGGYNKVRKGDIPYMARTNQCVWTGAIDALGGQVVSEDLVKCDYFEYQFQAGVQNFINAGDKIEIFIGQNITKDQNNTTKPFLVLTNTTIQSVILSNSGTYYFFARHSNGKCVWEAEVKGNIVNQLAGCN